METTHPFCFRGREGSAAVTYRGNEDPERWGYRLLGLPWPSSLATGLPVLEVDVSNGSARAARRSASSPSHSLGAAWVSGPR